MEKNSRSSKKALYIILAILGVVIVALAAAIVWLMLSKSSPEKKIESYINLGQEYLDDKDYESAILEFEKVLDLDSENVDAYVGLYEAYEGLEEYDKAMQICQDGYDETGSNKLKRKITYFQELLASSDVGNGVNGEVAENSVENTVENKEEETVVDSSDDIDDYQFAQYCLDIINDIDCRSDYDSFNVTDINNDGKKELMYFLANGQMLEAYFYYPSVSYDDSYLGLFCGCSWNSEYLYSYYEGLNDEGYDIYLFDGEGVSYIIGINAANYYDDYEDNEYYKKTLDSMGEYIESEITEEEYNELYKKYGLDDYCDFYTPKYMEEVTADNLSKVLGVKVYRMADGSWKISNGDDEQLIANEKMKAAYYDVLSDIYNYNKLLDGSTVLSTNYNDYINQRNSIYNTFAIYDIDFDGKDELMVSIRDTDFSYQMTDVVYGYDEDSNTVYQEMNIGPVDFYDDGTVIGYSLSMGESGCNPYYMYKYDVDKDNYVYKGNVEVFDIELGYEDLFPHEVDIDGNGVVYYIYDVDNNFDGNTPVDDEVYEEWLKGCGTSINKKEIEISTWKSLSEYKSIIE